MDNYNHNLHQFNMPYITLLVDDRGTVFFYFFFNFSSELYGFLKVLGRFFSLQTMQLQITLN